jgi:hypothetical protein
MNTFDSVFSKVCRLSPSFFPWITLTFFFLCMFSTTMNVFNNVFLETYKLSLCLFLWLDYFSLLFSLNFCFCLLFTLSSSFPCFVARKRKEFFFRWSNRLLNKTRKREKENFLHYPRKGLLEREITLFM